MFLSSVPLDVMWGRNPKAADCYVNVCVVKGVEGMGRKRQEPETKNFGVGVYPFLFRDVRAS